MNKHLENDQHIIADVLQELPKIVQKYLTFTGVVGYPWINTVRLKQVGRFRKGADQPWMPVTAEETYTTDPPSLHWNARFKVAGIPILRAKDTYVSGQGHMSGKLGGLFTLFDIRGEELDQAAMIRYLNEMMWLPTAFLGKNITWKEISEHSVQVTFSDHGKSVSAEMFFDTQGHLKNFRTLRYREVDGKFSLDPWSTPIIGYGKLAGLMLPIKGQAVWNLPSGDLPYAELEITEIHYNSAL